MTSLKKIPTIPDPHISEEKTAQQTEDLKLQMAKLQNMLYAEKKHSILMILQGMDTSGKDSTIRKVFSAINPQGCSVRSFKAPSEEEQLHDFLWRVHPHVPARGMITIFNRSHYEDILFPSVHKTIPAKVIKKRYEQINDFERYLQENGVVILKYYLIFRKKNRKHASRPGSPTRRKNGNMIRLIYAMKSTGVLIAGYMKRLSAPAVRRSHGK
jgi:polyphosphate kinase 2 (PPK2 family)